MQINQTSTQFQIHLPLSDTCIKINDEDNNFHQKTFSLRFAEPYTEKCTPIYFRDNEKNYIQPLITTSVKSQTQNYEINNVIQFNNQFIFNQPVLKSISSFQPSVAEIDMEELQLQRIQNFNNENESLLINEIPAKSPAKSGKFKAAGHALVGIQRLQHNIVEQISSTDQFDFKLNQKYKNNGQIVQINNPNKSFEDSQAQIAVNQKKFIYKITQYAEKGSPQDLEQIKKILQYDPKRNLLNPQDPQHILNQFNQYGQNSLYLAAKNGNLDIINFLLLVDCNPYIKSQINHKIQESPLEVCVRWRHLDCVKLLLDKVSYSNNQLEQALKVSSHNQITILLKSKMTTNFFSCFCCI